MEKKTKIVCPVCGAEFAISDRQHIVKNAVVIGKDSNLGVIELPLEKKNKSIQARIEQLKAVGIDTSKMYAMTDSKGEAKIGVVKKDKLLVLDPDENIEKILSEGTISSPRIFKQHVLAQMLRMLTSRDYEKRAKKGEFPLKKGEDGYYNLDSYNGNMSSWYDYCWNVVNDEIMRQSAMYRHGDTEMLNADRRWYNKGLVLSMIDNYYSQLVDLVRNMKRHYFKHKAYIVFNADALLPNKKSDSGYLYVSEFSNVTNELSALRKKIFNASNPIELHHAVEEFCKKRPSLYVKDSEYTPKGRRIHDNGFKPQVPQVFVNAYKGYGAYFSMQNLIMFHGCRIHLHEEGDESVLSKSESMKTLNKWADKNLDSAYWLIGALKQLLRDNNFDIEAKRKEWAEKYSK